MKYIIYLLLLLLCATACTSKSGNKPTPTRVSSYTVDIIRIQYDTANYQMINDTIAYDKSNKSWMVRIKATDLDPTAKGKRDKFIHVH